MSLWLKMSRMFTSSERLARFEKVLSQRTDRIVPVFENMHKPYNAAAVVRTCDALGVAYAHFIEAESTALFSRGISKGAQNWLDVSTYDSRDACLDRLRSEGFVFAATCFDENAIAPEELPLDEKIAVIFGNEKHGISAEALAACKYRIAIPMYGFVDSFNISVAAGILFYVHLSRVRQLPVEEWQLSRPQKKKLMRSWIFHNTRFGKLLRNKKWRKKLVMHHHR
jgi:tRNA (guanosine-2'-O-)-methyltransferase